MADFNVIYNIIAQDKFSNTSKRIGQSVNNIRDRFRGATGSVKGFSGALKILKSSAIIGAVVLGLRKITRVGGQFQDSLADLSAITGAVGNDLKFLRQEALALGKESARSGDEVLTAFKLVASAKPELLSNKEALAGVTKEVLLLANASGIDLTSAANITAQGLNIFGENADQASRFVNVLAAGAKFGASEIGQTGEAMLIAGPAARAAGLSFEQLNAAIQATALGGIKGSQAGTALNSILGRLQRAGLDFKQLGLEGSFKIVKDKMDSLTTSTERAKFAAKIFGEEHSKVGLALLNNVSSLSDFEQKLTGTSVAQEQADTRLATFNANVRKLGSIIEEKLVGAFLLLEPLLTALVKITGSAIEGLGTLIDVVILRPMKVLGTLIGKAVGFVGSGFDISGFKGMFGELADIVVGNDGETSKSKVDVNLNAPEGTVRSVKTKTSAGTKLNVGMNMTATAQ